MKSRRLKYGSTAGGSSAVFAYPVDLTVADSIERLVENVHRDLGPISILVTNSGGPPPGTFADATDEKWEFSAKGGSDLSSRYETASTDSYPNCYNISQGSRKLCLNHVNYDQSGLKTILTKEGSIMTSLPTNCGSSGARATRARIYFQDRY